MRLFAPIFLIFLTIGCVSSRHVFSVNGDNDIQQTDEKRTFGYQGEYPLIPEQFNCPLGHLRQDLGAYSGDYPGEKRQCEGFIIDPVNRLFIPVTNMYIIQIFDETIPKRGILRNTTFGALRDVIEFRDYGIRILNLEGITPIHGRGNYGFGRECGVPALELLEVPTYQQEPPEVITRDRSLNVDTQVVIAWQQQSYLTDTSIPNRPYYKGPKVTNIQMEYMFDTQAGENTGVMLIGAIPDLDGNVTLMTNFKCDAGVPYTAAEFYDEYGPYGNGEGSKRSEPISIVSFGEAIHAIANAQAQ